jgi:hypothetical protein
VATEHVTTSRSWADHFSKCPPSFGLGRIAASSSPAIGPRPPHVHMERDANRAKLWLDPVRLQDSGGFPRGELARIILMVREHEAALLRSWHDYFTD